MRVGRPYELLSSFKANRETLWKKVQSATCARRAIQQSAYLAA